MTPVRLRRTPRSIRVLLAATAALALTAALAGCGGGDEDVSLAALESTPIPTEVPEGTELVFGDQNEQVQTLMAASGRHDELASETTYANFLGGPQIRAGQQRGPVQQQRRPVAVRGDRLESRRGHHEHRFGRHRGQPGITRTGQDAHTGKRPAELLGGAAGADDGGPERGRGAHRAGPAGRQRPAPAARRDHRPRSCSC